MNNTEYALEIYNKNDEFIAQVDVFNTLEEAKKFLESGYREEVKKYMSDGEYFAIKAIYYKDEMDEYGDLTEIGVEQVYSDERWECVEMCPHCDKENIVDWNTETMGYVVKCQHCGEEILLCDDCMHSSDNEYRFCDWCETETGGKCFRGVTKNN